MKVFRLFEKIKRSDSKETINFLKHDVMILLIGILSHIYFLLRYYPSLIFNVNLLKPPE